MVVLITNNVHDGSENPDILRWCKVDENELSRSAKSITCPSVPRDGPYYIFNPIFTFSLQAEKNQGNRIARDIHGSQEMSRFPQET